jgi:hypothetical protein
MAPTILVPRYGRAQTAQVTSARAKQLLIIYAGGGMRSHALFSFEGASTYLNPYGVKGSPGSSKASFRLASPEGGNPDTAPFQQSAELLPEWGKQLPTLFGPTLEQFSLLGPIDHNPGGDPVLDRQTALNLISTGKAAPGAPGLLTIIGNKLTTVRKLPPFCLGAEASIFGAPAAGFEPGAPVYIDDPLLVGAQGYPYTRMGQALQGAMEGWELDLNRALDGSIKNRLPTFSAQPIDQVAGSREQLKAVQEVLARPQLRFNSPDNATAAFGNSNGVPLSNRRLEQAFLPFIRFQSGGLTTSSNFNDPLGAKMAMAVRLLQYGSPAVAVGYSGFDLHRDENRLMHTVSRPLGRAMSALLFVLGGMPGAEAKRLLDEVLVVVVSEWGRDGVLATTGYNDLGGSDHRGTASSRMQIWPVFGAGVKGGRVIGGFAPRDDLAPTGKVYSSASMSATMLSALGIDSKAYIDADPNDELFS